MPNKLIHETSPYLLQHANNPVDWHPWGDEALQKARDENKPIFLSIGYAACHWCHVMEHESFEDPQTAQLMNEHFVSIKVDREERPDLDSIYMNALVAITGQGGWPMSVFLTPEGEPFYGGTYFPSTRRYGMPSFKEVLNAIAQSWKNERGEIQRVGRELTQHLRDSSSLPGAVTGAPQPNILKQATQTLLQSYDWSMGGWGKAPRFPQPMAIEFLMLQSTRGEERTLDAASHALSIMSRGGMYDVIGGGFHRYSVDDAWLVPHFEKMLYDNSQLALTYLHAYLLTGSAWFRQVCIETLDFITREMTHSQGGFFSSLDADSEGEEGKYYVWTPEEINTALPEPADRDFLYLIYPVTARGNFEGKNIFQRKADLGELAQQMGITVEDLLQRLTGIHRQLYEVREQRVRPATDDKVLVSWNALALRAFAQAARYLKRDDYLQTARKNASFVLDAMYLNRRLKRAWRDGQPRHSAFLEDYAGLVLALLDLYQSDPEPRWFHAARQLCEDMLVHFSDPQGGFFDTSAQHGDLITRPKEVQDNAIPSGSALAAGALLMMAAFDERGEWQSRAEAMLVPLEELMVRHPTAFGFWLQDLDFAIGPVRQVALVGPRTNPQAQAMEEIIWQSYRPRMVVARSEGEPVPDGPSLLHERVMIQGDPAAFVCQSFTCNLPAKNAEALRDQLQ